MKAAGNIEKLIKKFCAKEKLCVKTSDEMDKRILDDALVAYKKSKKKTSAPTEPNIWRIIMKSRITKLAAAAMIIIAILISIYEFGGSIDGAGIAWADVVQRVEQSYNEYYTELLLAMEEKDVKKASYNADALSEFWQGINMLANAKLDPSIGFQSEDFLKLIKEKTFYEDYEQNVQQVFLEYSKEFMGWLNKIEDEAWIDEIIHISKEMEEYAEEIREPGRHPELDFSYAEHCLPGFVTYCEWFGQLPWDNPEQVMTPAMLLAGIQRDLQIARREIGAIQRKDADRVAKRCMRQALRNAQYLDKKIKSSQMFDQWKLCYRLTQKMSELSGLMAYLAVASGDITQTNKIHDPEAVHQILTGKFADRESFADYFVEQVDQSLDLCEQLWEELEST